MPHTDSSDETIHNPLSKTTPPQRHRVWVKVCTKLMNQGHTNTTTPDHDLVRPLFRQTFALIHNNLLPKEELQPISKRNSLPSPTTGLRSQENSTRILKNPVIGRSKNEKTTDHLRTLAFTRRENRKRRTNYAKTYELRKKRRKEK